MPLITLEGIDRSGKSTQARRLLQRLEEAGVPTLALREPGGTEVGEQVRKVLLDPENEMSAKTEVLLFAAARAEIVQKRVVPALNKGVWVVMDRFLDSSLAYQGAGREEGCRKWVQRIQEYATGGVVPDRTYLIDVPWRVSADRKDSTWSDEEAGDRIENEPPDFYQRVIGTYRTLATEKDRVVSVDGCMSKEAVHQTIWTDLLQCAFSDVLREKTNGAVAR